jgi:thioredoxin reductase (NADPH)
MDDIIRVYGASWCPDCRRAKRFLGDHRVSFEWHDIEVDPDGVRTVQERNDGSDIIPTIIFPDGSHLSEPSNEELAEKIGLERMAMMHVYDLIIVGGGPAGLTTSIYAARENLQTLVIDSKGLGGQAGVTERLDNYPGFPDGIGGAELADPIVQQAQRYGVEMLQAVSVRSISSDGEEVDVETATGDHYHARAALIATGSSYRMTGAPGEDDLIGGRRRRRGRDRHPDVPRGARRQADAHDVRRRAGAIEGVRRWSHRRSSSSSSRRTRS